ncbi:MAG: hypothetical protein AAF211_23195, partial [Myxococcota bacterium]
MILRVAVALVMVLARGWADDAWARVGGGESFGRSPGGGGGGGGGDGIPIDLVILLIDLCIRHPAIGIPVLLVVVGFVYARTFWSEQNEHH